MTQPALSHRLQKIEQEFGKKIFYVERKRLFFTADGEILTQHAMEMLTKEQYIRDKIANSGENNNGILRLGITDTYLRYKILPTLKEFINRYPFISLLLKSGASQDVVAMLRNGDIHIGICNINTDGPGEKISLGDDRIVIVSKKPINFKILPQEAMIRYIQNTALKTAIETWWLENYSEPPTANIEVKTIETALEMVRYGFGYSIVPELVLGSQNNLYMSPLKNKNRGFVQRTCWLRFRSQMLEYSTVKTFIDFITHVC
jgi:DNA-binding transcriptional LysR family regulator